MNWIRSLRHQKTLATQVPSSLTLFVCFTAFFFNRICHADVASERNAVLAKLKASPAYVDAVNDRDAKLKAKESALNSGSSEDIMRASSDYMEAKKKVSALEETAFSAAGIVQARPLPHPAVPETTVEPKRHWALKSTAPADMQIILNRLPQMKQEAVDALDKQIDKVKAEKETIKSGSVPGFVVGNTPFGGAIIKSDNVGLDNKWRRMQDCDHRVTALYKQKKILMADDLWLPEEFPLIWKIGEIGTLPSAHVLQVVDDHNVIADAGSESFWLSGIDTSPIVDDKTYSFGELVRISGTKKYDTAMGSTRKVYLVEPFDFKKYIEAVEE